MPIPDPYVGRSINEAGVKAKDLTHAVIIIVADGGKDPFILNMFPCDGLYIEGRTELA